MVMECHSNLLTVAGGSLNFFDGLNSSSGKKKKKRVATLDL